MTTKNAVISVTLTASMLRDLFEPVVPLAEQTPDLPILNAVQVHSVGDYLTATATDRFVLGSQRVKPATAPPAGIAAVVPLRAVKSILAMFKPSRQQNPDLRLDFTDATLSVVSMGITGLGIETDVRIPLPDFDAPPIRKLLGVGIKPEPRGFTSLNPSYLARFKAAQRHGLPMVLAFGKPGKPVYLAIGEDFRGLIQPVRLHDVEEYPVADDGWAEIADADANAKASAA